MKINWKEVSQSKGYKSLKAAYIYDISEKRHFGTKEQVYGKFKWVIDRAKHYSIRTGQDIATILNGWEEKRNMWWVGYYTHHNVPKLKKNP